MGNGLGILGFNNAPRVLLKGFAGTGFYPPTPVPVPGTGNKDGLLIGGFNQPGTLLIRGMGGTGVFVPTGAAPPMVSPLRVILPEPQVQGYDIVRAPYATLPSIQAFLFDWNGPVDLSEATSVQMRLLNMQSTPGENLTFIPCVTSEVLGAVACRWPAEPDGQYLISFVVTWGTDTAIFPDYRSLRALVGWRGY